MQEFVNSEDLDSESHMNGVLSVENEFYIRNTLMGSSAPGVGTSRVVNHGVLNRRNSYEVLRIS